MKKEVFVVLIIIGLLAAKGYCQKAALEKAAKKYDAFAYVDAIEIYKEIAKKGYKDEKMFQKLGNAYYFNSEFEKAEESYRELFSLYPDQNEELYFRYAQSLKSVGQYAAAEVVMLKFSEKSEKDQRAVLFKENQNYLEVIEANSNRYSIRDAGINSAHSDYGSSWFGNQLVFTSARDTGSFGKRIHKWNNKAFTNLYSAELKEGHNDSLGKPKRFNKGVNTRFHESSPVFTNDGKTMYFTRNNYNKRKKGKSSESIVLLKLYRAKRIDGKWANVTELPFNSNEYSTAHPVLSADEKTMYFVSDMPGSYGQSDLYKVAVKDNGTFGKPQNIGSEINTPGRETFPFVTDENELYFASDGHPGLGGLDIFVARIKKNGGFKNVQNLGRPINSPKDDFAYLLDTKTRTGYFSSDREGGKGSDDIYKFNELKKLDCEQMLEGVVRDSHTNDPVADVQITLYDAEMQKIQIIRTDKNGVYVFEPLECDAKYFIRVENLEYETAEFPYKMPKATAKTDLPILLKKRFVKVETGTDLAQPDFLDIPTVYFDLDKWEIHKDAAFELEKVLAFMNQNPTLKIDVRSHTDSRQTSQYNQLLSDKRAKSTIEWLVKNGIPADRLTGRGYGESQLINKCADGVLCTEAEHQMNRRSQFIVLEK